MKKLNYLILLFLVSAFSFANVSPKEKEALIAFDEKKNFFDITPEAVNKLRDLSQKEFFDEHDRFELLQILLSLATNEKQSEAFNQLIMDSPEQIYKKILEMFDEIKLRLSESRVESSMFFLKLPDFNILNISLSPSSPYLPNNVSVFSKLGVSIGEKPNVLKLFFMQLIIKSLLKI